MVKKTVKVNHVGINSSYRPMTYVPEQIEGTLTLIAFADDYASVILVQSNSLSHLSDRPRHVGVFVRMFGK